MSVNEAYTGKRHRTKKYNKFIRDVMMVLPPMKVPDGHLQITLEFAFSSTLSDFDNGIKTFVDVLQKKYGFNDRVIKRCILDVYNVDKGSEYIKFKLEPLARD